MNTFSTRAQTELQSPRQQRGVSLIELMVGLTIGLFIIGIGLAALQLSRQLSGTTSEAARLQQQAAYALRLIGNQVRPAGALELNLAFNKPSTGTSPRDIDPADPVAFMSNFDRRTTMLGTSDERPLQTAYAFYTEQLSESSNTPGSQLRDCLGSRPTGATVRNAFFLQKASPNAPSGELRCQGANASEGSQALISNVADFQVRWLRQRLIGGVPVMDVVNANTAAADWRKIYAVQVCLEMIGQEHMDTGDSTYLPCGASSPVARDGRLRLVYRNTYQIRTQGDL